MENNIQIFKNEQFGEIRTIIKDNEPWFVGNDVAKVLGYSNYRNSIGNHVDEEDKLRTQIEYAGQKREVTVINESGLYSLILSSKLPQAKEFKHWVTSEVLPQIRKTGGYIPVDVQDDEKTILCKAVNILMKTVEMQNKELAVQDIEIARLTPRAVYAEEVLLSPTCYTMTQIAKSLSLTVLELQNLLHDMRIIYRSPSGCWMLYADYLKKGYEAYRTRKGEDMFGNVIWTDTYLVWTEKGKEFIHNLIGKMVA